MADRTLSIQGLPPINIGVALREGRITPLEAEELEKIDATGNRDGIVTVPELDALDGHRSDGRLELERANISALEPPSPGAGSSRSRRINAFTGETRLALASAIETAACGDELERAARQVIREEILEGGPGLRLSARFNPDSMGQVMAFCRHAAECWTAADPLDRLQIGWILRGVLFGNGGRALTARDTRWVRNLLSGLACCPPELLRGVVSEMTRAESGHGVERQNVDALLRSGKETRIGGPTGPTLETVIEEGVRDGLSRIPAGDDYNTQLDNDATFFPADWQCGPTVLAMLFSDQGVTAADFARAMAKKLGDGHGAFSDARVKPSNAWMRTVEDLESLPATKAEKVGALAGLVGVTPAELRRTSEAALGERLGRLPLDVLLTTYIGLGLSAESGAACVGQASHYGNYGPLAKAAGLNWSLDLLADCGHRSLPTVLERIDQALAHGQGLMMLVRYVYESGGEGHHYVRVQEVVRENGVIVGLRVDDPFGKMVKEPRGWAYPAVRSSGSDNVWSQSQLTDIFVKFQHARIEVVSEP
jgi:hypothetical protein